MDPNGALIDAEAEELLDRCLNVADFYSHTRILHALDSAFELSIKIQLGHLRDKTLPCGLFLNSAY